MFHRDKRKTEQTFLISKLLQQTLPQDTCTPQNDQTGNEITE